MRSLKSKVLYLICLIVIFLIQRENINSQEIRILDVDEKDFPKIKVTIEFPEPQQTDFAKISILETGDTVVYSIDSLAGPENHKAICILIDNLILFDTHNQKHFEWLISEISSVLNDGDKLNIILTKHSKSNQDCIIPVSFEFTSDFPGIIKYLLSHTQFYTASGKSTISICSLEKTLEFISSKKNLPAKKLLYILSNSGRNITDSLPEIKNKTNEIGLSVCWQDYQKLKEPGINIRQKSFEIVDSIFSEKFKTSYTGKKLYQLTFFTKQKGELNQFEIGFNGKKQRSTFAKPGYMSFFRENIILLGVIAFFLLLIIFFIVNLIYTKKQMMISVRQLKSNTLLNPASTDIGFENASPEKTNYGTGSITPYLTVELEGKTRNYDLNKLITRIGRHQENDILIDNMTISNIHATLTFENNQFFIQDNISTNGTYVNDVKISKVVIKNGDIIRIGKARLTLTC